MAISKLAEGWKFTDENVDGIINYRLHLKTEQSQLEYFIQPQYQLGKSQGVQYSTRADFLIRCLSATVNGKEWNTEDLQQIKPIAIYLDGYQYHATKENPRFEKDVACRHSILDSGAFYSWTLTYQDVLLFEEQLGDKIAIDSLHKMLNSTIKTALKGHPIAKGADTNLFARTNNLDRLVWVLENVTVPLDMDAAIRYYLSCFQTKFGSIALKEKDVIALIKNQQSTSNFSIKNKGAEAYCSLNELQVAHTLFDFNLFSRVKDFQFQSSLLVEKTANDFDKDSWSAFWYLFNLLQLIDAKAYHLERQGDFFQFQLLNPSAIETTVEVVDNTEVLQYYDDEYHPIINQLIQHQIPFSQDGSFVLMNEGEDDVVAEAVLGFQKEKIVLEPLDEEYLQIFEDLGYTIVEIANFDITMVRDEKISTLPI